MSCLVQFQLARYERSRDKRKEEVGQEMEKYRSKNQMSNTSPTGWLSIVWSISMEDVVGSDSVEFRLLFKGEKPEIFLFSQKARNFQM